MLKLLPLLAAFLSLALLAFSSPAAAKEAPAYVAIGDSLAFGVGAADPVHSGYAAVTHDALRRSERYRDRGLALVNLGVPGATSSDLLLPGGQVDAAIAEIRERIEDASSSDDNVEIITVNVGGNDVLGLATSDSPCLADLLSSACQDRFRDMLAELEQNLTQMLERLRDAAPRADIVLIDLYSPISGRGGAADIIADLAIREINAVVGQVVSESDLRVKLASIYSLFRGRAHALVAADSFHPNDKGHSLIAEVVLAAIEDREPDLPKKFRTPTAVEGIEQPPLGEGGLLPLSQHDDGGGSSLLLLLALAIPVSVFGAAAVVGAYLTARGR